MNVSNEALIGLGLRDMASSDQTCVLCGAVAAESANPDAVVVMAAPDRLVCLSCAERIEPSLAALALLLRHQPVLIDRPPGRQPAVAVQTPAGDFLFVTPRAWLRARLM
jgi:hypothetical protein